jgi:hypothetical protein
LLRDRLRRPWTEPACRQVRRQPGSGEGSGQATVRSMLRCRPVSSDDDGRRAAQCRTRPEVTRHVSRPPLGSRLASPDTVRRPGRAATEGSEGCGKLQINSLFCKPICKPDAARPYETGETEPTERDGICPVCRGHHACGRRSETGETHVVWLITQRSRVQIPPPLPRPEALFRTGRGPLARVL